MGFPARRAAICTQCRQPIRWGCIALHRESAGVLSRLLPSFPYRPRRPSMEISAARVASIHYTLTDDEGRIIDQSSESRPLRYFHGAGNIIPGLEKALAGKQAGDALQVQVRPEEAYGVRNEGMVQVLPRESFKGVDKVEPGMQFEAQGERG